VFGTVAIVGLVLLPWILVPGLLALIGWRLFGRRIAAWAERVSKP